jgi:hypothetical protein
LLFKSLTSKFVSFPVTLTHCLWWSLIWTRAWHLWLSRAIFITGSYCFVTSRPKIKYCLFAVAGWPTHLKCTRCKKKSPISIWLFFGHSFSDVETCNMEFEVLFSYVSLWRINEMYNVPYLCLLNWNWKLFSFQLSI